MNRAVLKHYTILIDFLSQALGPDYEIALHDLSDKSNSIVAIANGYISGRTIGAPLTSMMLKTIKDKSYLDANFRINYSGLSNGSKVLRSSTLYIKDPSGKLAGLLCINFDDSRYQELSTRLFQLCHPDEFVERNIVIRSDLLDAEPIDGDNSDESSNSVASIADSVMQEVIAADGVPADRLTQEEKIQIVGMLNQRGVFLLKGAVNQVAKAMHSSPASIYRYLSKLESSAEHYEKEPSGIMQRPQ